jgi:16S rRNA (guanine966-N2)-methyltransferase
MRIIAGKLKGRNIELAKGSKARPATSFVRELVMNLYQTGAPDGSSLLPRGAFLDLFAASGSMGFEALSRGAPFACFVEADSRSAGAITRSAHQLEVQAQVKVLVTDARRCFGTLDKLLGVQRISAAFVDPPFMPGFAAGFLQYLGRGNRIFAPEALIIVRSSEKLPLGVAGLHLVESRSGGNATLYLYRPALTAEDAADGS